MKVRGRLLSLGFIDLNSLPFVTVNCDYGKLWGKKNGTKRGLKSQQQNDNKSSILFRTEKFLAFQEKYIQKPDITELFYFGKGILRTLT